MTAEGDIYANQMICLCLGKAARNMVRSYGQAIL